MSRVYVIHPTNSPVTDKSRIGPVMDILGNAISVPPRELSLNPVSSTVISRGGFPSAYNYTVFDLLHKGKEVNVARFVILIGYIPQCCMESLIDARAAIAPKKNPSYFTKKYEGLRNGIRSAISQSMQNIPKPTIRHWPVAEELEVYEMRDVDNKPLPLE